MKVYVAIATVCLFMNETLMITMIIANKWNDNWFVARFKAVHICMPINKHPRTQIKRHNNTQYNDILHHMPTHSTNILIQNILLLVVVSVKTSKY